MRSARSPHYACVVLEHELAEFEQQPRAAEQRLHFRPVRNVQLPGLPEGGQHARPALICVPLEP
eukprot:4912944-Prymnesium_polylepis.1